MSTNILKGNQLMVFLGGETLAYATNNTLTVTGNTVDISSKDHGQWGASEVANFSWEISCDNLYTSEGYAKLFDAMVNKTLLTVIFGNASNYNADGLTVTGGSVEKWAAPTADFYTGKVCVTSLTANANNGENASYTATLTGMGTLSHTVGA